MLLLCLSKYIIPLLSFLTFVKCSPLEKENNTIPKLVPVNEANTKQRSASQLLSQIINWSKENEEYDVVNEEDLEDEEFIKVLNRRGKFVKKQFASIDYFLFALVEDVKQLDYMVEQNRQRTLNMWRNSLNNNGAFRKINWFYHLGISFVLSLILI